MSTRNLLLLVLVGTILCVNTSAQECGFPKKQTMDRISARIIGGEESRQGAWPWMAGITEIKRSINARPICGGLLLNEKWVLSTASCFLVEELGNERVTLGDKNYRIEEGTEQRRTIARIVYHPKFNINTADFDYAMLELDSPVEINDYVRPICLPPSLMPESRFAGKQCKIIGWGISEIIDDTSAIFPRNLQEGNVRVFNRTECEKAWNQFNTITPNMVCASGRNFVPETCFGDSGGPLQCQNERTGRWFVWGITSFSTGTCDGLPTVYAFVPAQLKWIREVLSW
uniref:Peptidase S1 domain-containing protein n=2 Tax=Clytia hemisphaerica TaxID=252671 RepID=A0A7M5XJU6_9CNID